MFKPGEEPLIAAAVMDLFSLLPNASHFVEALVKLTINLENVMLEYKGRSFSTSPFRTPLAKYLNRHYSSAVGFFLEEHRLCNPVFSSLFHDMLRRDDTTLLRNYLSNNGTQLLNICFGVPLSIVRSEKSSDGRPVPSSVSVYGTNDWSSIPVQRKLEVARQDIETKKKVVALKSQDDARAQKLVHSKAEAPNAADYKAKARAVHEALNQANNDLEEARSAYARDVYQANEHSTMMGKHERAMTVSSLELQFQGLKIVQILTALNPQYLVSQKNDVARALRWLWRSRGRHYRLLHEEEIPPRYNNESISLGQFLISYAMANSTDPDVLFDMIRIFMSVIHNEDFSFIKDFLLKTVCVGSERKGLIVQR